MSTPIESDIVEILKRTMEADMGIYKPGSVKLKLIKKNKADKALVALNHVNIDKNRKQVQAELRAAGRSFLGPPKTEGIGDEKWKQWSLQTNLASCCFSLVFPHLAIGLCEWCDPANPSNAKSGEPPKKLDRLNQVLSLWAKFNLALAYKDTKRGTDETEENLRKIAEPDSKLYPDFENNPDELFEIARAALQWQSLIQMCEIHKDRQEKTRFEEKRQRLIVSMDLRANCSKSRTGEDCNKSNCVLFSSSQDGGDSLLDRYKLYIAGLLFLLCQEYHILSMRASCRKKEDDRKRAEAIAVQGHRVFAAIKYWDAVNESSPLKTQGIKNKLYLIALMYIHEVLQSIDDANLEESVEKEKQEPDERKTLRLLQAKFREHWKEIVNFIHIIEKEPVKSSTLFPERFEWWPKIIRVMVPAIDQNDNKTLKKLTRIITSDGTNVEMVEWIKEKLQSLGSNNPMNPTNVLKAIDGRIHDQSMTPKDVHDPEIEMQKNNYREVVGRFYDSRKYKDDEIRKLEIALIREFLGCDGTAVRKLNRLRMWSEAQLCARRRFLEIEDCYKQAQCYISNGKLQVNTEDRLSSVLSTMFGKSEAEISHGYLDGVMLKSRGDFKERLCNHSCHKGMENRFGVVCLRRWQSYTPALSAPQKVSRGGGYFVFRCGSKGKVVTGVVIDPGIYFLENFLEEGFSIQDIDAVLLTHSHIDHRDDLESILTLIHEAAKNKAPKNIKMVVTKGCWDDIGAMIRRNRKHIDDIYTIEDLEVNSPSEIKNIADRIKVEWKKAYHECFDGDCVGYCLSRKVQSKARGFRFTGDTVYPSDGLGISGDDNVVMLNLGGLVSEKNGTDGLPWTLKKVARLAGHRELRNWTLETSFLEHHLYLAGALRLLDSWHQTLEDTGRTGLAILCELPEELSGGHRSVIAKTIQKAINSVGEKDTENSAQRIIVLPEDVGLRISYQEDSDSREDVGPQIECLYCSQLVSPRDVEVVPWGLEERLMFVCKNCREAATPYLLEEKFKNYRDRGRSFQRAEP